MDWNNVFESFCVAIKLPESPSVDDCKNASILFCAYLTRQGYSGALAQSVKEHFEQYLYNKIEIIGKDFKFYKTFINLMDTDFEIDDQQKVFTSDPGFRKRLMEGYIDARLIKEIAPYYAMLVKKPQKLEVDLESGYMALDLATNTWYFCSNTLMVDVDSYKMENGQDVDIKSILPHCMCQIEQVIENFQDIDHCDFESGIRRKATWMNYKCKHGGKAGRKVIPECQFHWCTYKSRNGWHAFLLSHNLDPKSDIAIQLLIEAQADLFYIVFCYLRYWSVRLNRKEGEVVGKDGMYPYLGDMVKGKIIKRDKTSKVLQGNIFNVNLHLKFAEMCKNERPVIGSGKDK